MYHIFKTYKILCLTVVLKVGKLKQLIEFYFNQRPNSTCYNALLGFYFCQSKNT